MVLSNSSILEPAPLHHPKTILSHFYNWRCITPSWGTLDRCQGICSGIGDRQSHGISASRHFQPSSKCSHYFIASMASSVGDTFRPVLSIKNQRKTNLLYSCRSRSSPSHINKQHYDLRSKVKRVPKLPSGLTA